MDSDSRNRALVVDLLRYRQTHRQRQLDHSGPGRPAAVLAPVSPFRPLTSREIAHRQRMAKFMGGQRAEGKGQR